MSRDHLLGRARRAVLAVAGTAGALGGRAQHRQADDEHGGRQASGPRPAPTPGLPPRIEPDRAPGLPPRIDRATAAPTPPRIERDAAPSLPPRIEREPAQAPPRVERAPEPVTRAPATVWQAAAEPAVAAPERASPPRAEPERRPDPPPPPPVQEPRPQPEPSAPAPPPVWQPPPRPVVAAPEPPPAEAPTPPKPAYQPQHAAPSPVQPAATAPTATAAPPSAAAQADAAPDAIVPTAAASAETAPAPVRYSAAAARAPEPVRSMRRAGMRPHLWLTAIVLVVLAAGATGYWVLRVHQRISQASLEQQITTRQKAPTVRCSALQSDGSAWACAVVYRVESVCLIAKVNVLGSWSTVVGHDRCARVPELERLLPATTTAGVSADIGRETGHPDYVCRKLPGHKVRWACGGPPATGRACLIVRVVVWTPWSETPGGRTCAHFPALQRALRNQSKA